MHNGIVASFLGFWRNNDAIIRLWARFQKRSARDRLRYNPVILIRRSHSTKAYHDRLIRSRKYETKQFIANWIVTNHSLGNLEFKLRGCIIEWKTSDWWYLFMTSQREVWWRHSWVPIRERHGQFSARTQRLLTIQQGLDMPYLTGMCMWLPLLKIFKLLTQDRPCPSECFPFIYGF